MFSYPRLPDSPPCCPYAAALSTLSVRGLSVILTDALTLWLCVQATAHSPAAVSYCRSRLRLPCTTLQKNHDSPLPVTSPSLPGRPAHPCAACREEHKDVPFAVGIPTLSGMHSSNLAVFLQNARIFHHRVKIVLAKHVRGGYTECISRSTDRYGQRRHTIWQKKRAIF